MACNVSGTNKFKNWLFLRFLFFKLIAKQIRKIIDAEKPVLIGGQQVPKPIVNDILVDFYLWNYRVDNAAEIDSNSLPFHKIRCIFY